jgi:tight adherence protein C
MVPVAALAAAAAAALVVAAIGSMRGPSWPARSLPGSARFPNGTRRSRAGLVERLAGLAPARLSEPDMAERLALAGWVMSAQGYAVLRVAGLALGCAFPVLAPWPGPLVAPILGTVGAHAPRILLARAVERRRRRMDAEVPQLLDLLAASSTAGLAAPLALSRSVAPLHGPLADELRSSLRAIDLGAGWREELSRLADRLRLPDLRRAVVAITRTETLGSSLVDSTTQLAARVREARRAVVVERARTAPVKMLFPLVFLVLPSFLLLTVVPVLLTTLRSMR